MRKLPRSFYLRPTLQVARELLGKFLVRRFNGELLIGKIVEVEAYLGERDPASHAFRGMTKRNEVMFRRGGHLYVYFTYGMHHCCNVVTEVEGLGRAVLIRAVEPVCGIEMMKRNRYKNKVSRTGRVDAFSLTNGPAKLCQALCLSREQNGMDLMDDDLYLTEGETIQPRLILRSRRIGIASGIEKRW